MKFCLQVTVALDIFIKEKNNNFLDFSFVIFLCKRCLLGQTKRTTLSTLSTPPYPIDPPRIFQPPPLPAYYILHKFPPPAY